MKMTSQSVALLRDAVDLHVHSSPCLFGRWGTDNQLVREADVRGLGGIMIKSHFESTVGRANAVSQAGKVRVFGGLVLNPFLGGINPDTVEVACRLGARMIWMPTLLSVPTSEHVDLECLGIRDKAKLPRTNDFAAVRAIAATIREHDAVLASGHLSAAESLLLFDVCHMAGLKKLVFTHPFSPIVGATDEEIIRAVEKGAKIEIDAFAFVYTDQSLIPRAVRMIRSLGAENFYLSSDGGQAGYPNPCTSLDSLARMLSQAGVPLRDLETMMRSIPSELMGMQ